MTTSKPVPPGTPPPSPPPGGPTHPTPTGPGPGRASFSLDYALRVVEPLLADAHALLAAVDPATMPTSRVATGQAVAEFRAGTALVAVRELAELANLQTPGSAEADAAPSVGPGFHLPQPPGPPRFERARRIDAGTRVRALVGEAFARRAD